MFVGKGEEYLPDISLKDLKQKYNQEASDKAKVRLRCAYLRKMGESIPAIASVTGKRESTVSDILRRLAERGLTASHAIKQTGQPQKLNQKQKYEFKIAIINPPLMQNYPFVHWTTSLVEFFIMDKFGITIGRRHLQRILKSLGLKLNKTTHEHILANELLQKNFKKKNKRGLQNLCCIDKRSPYWSQ